MRAASLLQPDLLTPLYYERHRPTSAFMTSDIASTIEHFPAKWTPVRRRKCEKQGIGALSADSFQVESALVFWIKHSIPGRRSANVCESRTQTKRYLVLWPFILGVPNECVRTLVWRRALIDLSVRQASRQLRRGGPLDDAVGQTQHLPIRSNGLASQQCARAAALLGAMAVAAVTNGVVVSTPASAQETRSCSDHSVMARGEASRFEWLARTKARANWRHRVRSTPDLGSSYSDWKVASNLEESCLVGPEGSVCTITAVPCRK